MAYIQKIKEDFQDKSIFHAWRMMEKRMHGDDFYTLIHPCNMKEDLLRKLIPHNFKADELLELLPAKQKEIARRLNISGLPKDRPSGMLGQSALFEILRNRGFDFKSYVNGFHDNWVSANYEGHVLIFILGYIYYLRRFFGYTPIDLVQYLLEPITRYQMAITWDENWVNRIITNIYSVSPCNMSNSKINQILKRLMSIQDGWGMTTARVMEWIGVSRAEAVHLIDILRASWVEHRYRLVSKNTGTAKILTKSQSKWKTVPSFYSSCTSLTDDKDYFISLRDVFKEDRDEKFLEREAMNTNVDLYDFKNQVWNLHPSTRIFRSTNDIIALFQNSDYTVPDNKILPTQRDFLFIALLAGTNTNHSPKKRSEITHWFTKGFGIPKEDVEIGIRNVLRKNLVRNQYTHYAIMEDREVYAIIFDDKSNKVIPFLGEVLPNLPFFWLETNVEMNYGLIIDFHPSYLSCETRNLIESSMNVHDVSGELFVLNSWGFGEPGSILQMISDDDKIHSSIK